MHGLSPSIKCVAPLFGDISLVKEMEEGARAHIAPPSCAPDLIQHLLCRLQSSFTCVFSWLKRFVCQALFTFHLQDKLFAYFA